MRNLVRKIQKIFAENKKEKLKRFIRGKASFHKISLALLVQCAITTLDGKFAFLLLLIQYFCISQVPFCWTDTQFQLPAAKRPGPYLPSSLLYLLPYCFHGSFRRKCNIEGHSLFQPLLHSAIALSSNHDNRCCS